jgi:hypothetical protein
MAYWGFRTPAEVIKTQVQTGLSPNVKEAFDVAKSKNENGVFDLWKHYPVMLWLDVPFQIMNFILYGLVSDAVLNAGYDTSIWTRLFCGVTCGMVSAAVTCPIDVCKTRIISRDRQATATNNAVVVATAIEGREVSATTVLTSQAQTQIIHFDKDKEVGEEEKRNNTDELLLVDGAGIGKESDDDLLDIMMASSSSSSTSSLSSDSVVSGYDGSNALINAVGAPAIRPRSSSSSSSSSSNAAVLLESTDGPGLQLLDRVEVVKDVEVEVEQGGAYGSGTSIVSDDSSTSGSNRPTTLHTAVVDTNLIITQPVNSNDNNNNKNSNNVPQELVKIAKEEGVGALFLGIGQRLLYVGLANGIRLAAYGTSRMDLMMRSLDDL